MSLLITVATLAQAQWQLWQSDKGTYVNDDAAGVQFVRHQSRRLFSMRNKRPIAAAIERQLQFIFLELSKRNRLAALLDFRRQFVRIRGIITLSSVVDRTPWKKNCLCVASAVVSTHSPTNPTNFCWIRPCTDLNTSDSQIVIFLKGN